MLLLQSFDPILIFSSPTFLAFDLLHQGRDASTCPDGRGQRPPTWTKGNSLCLLDGRFLPRIEKKGEVYAHDIISRAVRISDPRFTVFEVRILKHMF